MPFKGSYDKSFVTFFFMREKGNGLDLFNLLCYNYNGGE